VAAGRRGGGGRKERKEDVMERPDRRPGLIFDLDWWRDVLSIVVLIVMTLSAVVLTLFAITVTILHTLGIFSPTGGRLVFLWGVTIGGDFSGPYLYWKILRRNPRPPP
jgi:hypothetical protein